MLLEPMSTPIRFLPSAIVHHLNGKKGPDPKGYRRGPLEGGTLRGLRARRAHTHTYRAGLERRSPRAIAERPKREQIRGVLGVGHALPRVNLARMTASSAARATTTDPSALDPA